MYIGQFWKSTSILHSLNNRIYGIQQMDSDQQFVICGAHCESVSFCESTRKHSPILSLSDICFISNGEINKIIENVSLDGIISVKNV